MTFSLYDETDPARISNDIIPPLYAPPLPTSTPPYITLDGEELTAEQLNSYLADNNLLPPSSTPCVPFIEDTPESFLPVGRANIYLGECAICGESEDGAVAYPPARKNAALTPADRRRKLFLLRCVTCHVLVHPQCLHPPLNLMSLLAVSTRLSGGPPAGKPSAFSATLWNEWRCTRCKCCSMCQRPPEADRPLLVCHSCDRGYHPECTRETLTVRPMQKGHEHNATHASDPITGLQLPLTVADTIFYCTDCVGRTLAPSEKRQFEYVKAQYKKKLRRMFPQPDQDTSEEDDDDDGNNKRSIKGKNIKKKKNKKNISHDKSSWSEKKKKSKKEKEKEKEKEKRKKKRRKSEGHRSNNADSSAADDSDNNSNDDDDDDDDDSSSHVSSRKRKKNRSSHSNKQNKR